MEVTWSAFGPTLFLRVLIWLPSLPDHCRKRPLPFAWAGASRWYAGPLAGCPCMNSHVTCLWQFHIGRLDEQAKFSPSPWVAACNLQHVRAQTVVTVKLYLG